MVGAFLSSITPNMCTFLETLPQCSEGQKWTFFFKITQILVHYGWGLYKFYTYDGCFLCNSPWTVFASYVTISLLITTPLVGVSELGTVKHEWVVSEWASECMSEWASECMSEWASEHMSEWANKRCGDSIAARGSNSPQVLAAGRSTVQNHLPVTTLLRMQEDNYYSFVLFFEVSYSLSW